FRGMTQSTAEIINSIRIVPSITDTGNMNWMYIAITGLAETFIASGCWFVAEHIIERHRPSIRIDNPIYKKNVSELDKTAKAEAEQINLRDIIVAKMGTMDEARKKYVEEAVGAFMRVESVTSQNQ